MSDESERDERVERAGAEGHADHAMPSDDPVVPANGDEIDFSVPADERSATGHGGESRDGSRIDGLPEGWLDSDAVVGRGGSGHLDLLGEADESPRGVLAAEESGVSHASRVQIGTGRSGIVASSDVLADPGSDDRQRDGGESRSEPASAVADGGADPEPSGASPDPGEDSGVADEWGDIVAGPGDDVLSESVGFGALLVQDAADRAAASDSYADDSQGIVRGPEEPIEVAVPVIATARPVTPRRSGGIGQLLGVVLGGVLAIPVTLAILLWGFQRDPLGVARSVPEGMRFLLPQKVRRTVEPKVPSVTGSSLDAIASSAAETLRSTPADGVEATSRETPSPAVPADGPVPDAPIADATPLPGTPDGVEPVAVLPAGSIPSGTDETTIAIDAPPVAGLGNAVVPTPPAARLPDLGPLDGAVERALLATENLGRIDPAGDPQVREQSLVAWYRGLAEAANLLAVAEKEAADGGVAPAEALGRYEGLAMRLATERVRDIADLGAMWLTAARRPSEGAVLVGSLEESRAAGPWRWGRLQVRGNEPRSVTFFARSLDGVEPGDDVMVTGVLGDASAMWASDVRRVAAPVEPAPAATVPAETTPGGGVNEASDAGGETSESPVAVADQPADTVSDAPASPEPTEDAPAPTADAR